MNEVKRYDAVHIRYEDNNIRYGEGCEVEVVTARDYDALEAECERLRKEKSARQALSIQLIDEARALRAYLAAIKGQEPVAWGAFHFGGMRDGKLYSQCDTEAAVEAYILDVHRSNDSLTLRKGPLYTDPQPAPAQYVAGWIPVTERLPNCGQAVLAYYLNRQGMGRRIRAEYVTRWTVEAEMFDDPDTECVEYSEQADAYYVTEGWYELIDNWGEYSSVSVTEGIITHWMPLPAAPASDKQSGEVKS